MNSLDETTKRITVGAALGLSVSALLLLTKRLFSRPSLQKKKINRELLKPTTSEEWERIVNSNQLVVTFVGNIMQYQAFSNAPLSNPLIAQLSKVAYPIWVFIDEKDVKMEDETISLPVIVVHHNQKRLQIIPLK